MSIYKACDIRGVFGAELTLAHATALGHALARHASPHEVLVGGDGRLSTPALKSALIHALVEAGVRVLDLGAAPTPVFYHTRRKMSVRVGVMVTASHNPAPDNGFKIVLGDLPITEAELDELRQLMEAGARCEAGTPGEVIRIEAVDEYLAHLEALYPERGRLRVVVDAGNGMWGPHAPRLLRRLGYEVVELFTEVDGNFPNRSPNPALASSLTALCARVRETKSDLGAAYDGDGDRVAFVDEQGQVVTNDCAIVLLARQALAAHPGATIVYDQKCSDVVREEIVRGGGMPRREKSGYAFIKTALYQTGAPYAGELSGHHFFAEVGGDDGLAATLKMAALVQASGRPLSDLVREIPRYPITPDLRLRVAPGEGEAILAALKRNLRGALEIEEQDGLRAQFADGWGLARASVTEPALTFRFEGRTEAALARIQSAFVAAAPQLEGRL